MPALRPLVFVCYCFYLQLVLLQSLLKALAWLKVGKRLSQLNISRKQFSHYFLIK